MKNIHVLLTDKPSKLYYFTANKAGYYLYPNNELVLPINPNCQNQNIYITSDEEIKEGDFYFYKCGINGLVDKAVKSWKTLNESACKKVILTTDVDLIKDGIQTIDNEFLEWFIKNPSCEYVEFESKDFSYNKEYWYTNYKIIIPKEEIEHKGMVLTEKEVLDSRSDAYAFIDFDKQETLEEASLNFSKKYLNNGDNSIFGNHCAYLGFINGAKWQQERSYSEEEVDKLISLLKQTTEYEVLQSFRDKVEQFKKK